MHELQDEMTAHTMVKVTNTTKTQITLFELLVVFFPSLVFIFIPVNEIHFPT